MLRLSICLIILIAGGRQAAAQGLGGTNTARNTTGTAATAGTAQAGVSGGGGLTAAAPTPGSGFTFDPRFGATSFGGGLGAGLGGLGGGLGGLGGGLGGFGGGLTGGRFGGFGGGFGGRGGFGQSQQQQNQSKIRATAKVGFEFDVPTAQSQATAIRSTLARLPLPAKFDQAQIEFSGRQVIVSGNFQNPDDVEVLKRLLLLEPGVESVEVRTATVKSAIPTEVVPAPPVAQ